jgi:hypothetical protein
MLGSSLIFFISTALLTAVGFLIGLLRDSAQAQDRISFC